MPLLLTQTCIRTFPVTFLIQHRNSRNDILIFSGCSISSQSHYRITLSYTSSQRGACFPVGDDGQFPGTDGVRLGVPPVGVPAHLEPPIFPQYWQTGLKYVAIMQLPPFRC